MSAADVAMVALARTAPGIAPTVSPQHGLAVEADLLIGQVEQSQQVGVGAEAPVTDADAVLCAQPCRDQRVVHTFDGERRDWQGRRTGTGSEHSDAGDRSKTGAQPLGQLVVVSFDRRPADPLQLIDGRVQGDGTDDVGGAGLLPLGRIGPHDLVEIDEIDGAAASQERIAVGEGVPRADEGAGAEGRVHLVPAPRDVVDGRWDRAMGRELGGIDEHRNPTGAGRFGDVLERWHPAGDVRRAADGKQLRAGRSRRGRRRPRRR